VIEIDIFIQTFCDNFLNRGMNSDLVGGQFGWFMVFNATFNNISVLLVKETVVP